MTPSIRPIPEGLAQAFLVHERWPSLDRMLNAFAPIDSMLAQLDAGEIDTINGRPSFLDWEGDWYELAPALLGWCDAMERIARAIREPLDMDPMRRMARRLDSGILLTPADVARAHAITNRCRAIFLACPNALRRAAATEATIAIKIEALGLRRAA